MQDKLVLNKYKPGTDTDQLDIAPIPPDVEARRCTDNDVKQEALKYFTELSSDRYLGVVHETPIPRLIEIAFNELPGTGDECKKIAALLTGGAKLHKVLI